MVFEPSVAPRDPEQFRAWYRPQTEWTEDHGYNDPAVPSASLRSWYETITGDFPNLNGEGVSDDEVGIRHTDYSLGSNAIYAAFAWSQAEEAYDLVRSLAVEHSVGFYDVSGGDGDGEIYFPGDSLRGPSGGRWREVSASFRNEHPNSEVPKRRWFDIFRRDK